MSIFNYFQVFNEDANILAARVKRLRSSIYVEKACNCYLCNTESDPYPQISLLLFLEYFILKSFYNMNEAL